MSKFAGLGAEVDATRRLVLQHPVTGQPLRHAETKEEAWIDLLPMDSEAARKHERAALNRRIARRANKVKAEELEAETTELLAKLTRGWSLVTLSGKPLSVPFSEANAVELYSEPELSWVKRQVNEFVADVGNWTPANSTP